MIHTTYDELQALIDKGCAAMQYTLDHYEELAAREAVYTLYGPFENFLGAVSPCSLMKESKRKLSVKNRRKTYTIYEFDKDFRPIRIGGVIPNTIRTVYHLFELDGVTYGCDFFAESNKIADRRVVAYKLVDGKPVFYAHTDPYGLYCEFYEDPSEGSRLCTGYLYSIGWGDVIHKDDPHVSTHCREIPIWDFDFAKYFKKAEKG